MALPNSHTSQVCRNVVVSGRRTSIRMEQVMWDCLSDICREEGRSLNEIVTIIDSRRGESNLTGAIRVFIISYYRDVARTTSPRAGGFNEAAEPFDIMAENGPSAEPGDLVWTALNVLGTGSR